MSIFFYCLGYLALIAFVAVAVLRIIGYVKKPKHLRWELYPVAHESAEKVEYGGSYLENTEWWKDKYHSSVIGALKGFLIEALFLKAVWEHNRVMWIRTYPFHIGLYLLLGALGLTFLAAIGKIACGCGNFVAFCTVLTIICDVLGFFGLLWGSIGLIQRRLCDSGLRKYSTPEHFFNLACFGVIALLGLLLCLGYGVWNFAMMGNNFIYGMLTFTAMEMNPLYVLYLLVTFFMFFWVPYSFLGHFFMKYFTWHDIRWDDAPAVNNPKLQAKMANNLNFPVSWRGNHVQGDGKKTWAAVASENPDED